MLRLSCRISSSHVHIAHGEIGEGTDSDKESAPNLTCAAPGARPDFGIRFPHGVTAFSVTSPMASNAPRLRIVMYECSHKNIIRRREAGRLDRSIEWGIPKACLAPSLSIAALSRGQSLARSFLPSR